MKRSCARETRQLTKGGSLPRRRGLGIFDGCTPFGVGHEASFSSTIDGAPLRSGDRAVSSSQIRLFLENAILRLFVRDGRTDCSPGAKAKEPDLARSAVNTGTSGSDRNCDEGLIAASRDRDETARLSIPRVLTRKRIFDLALVFLTICIWLPLMMLIMVLIKIASPGPIFYRQERVGYRGNRFMIFKFRSMTVNADPRAHEDHVERLMMADVPMTKLDASDPRLIRWGRMLRATGLDELPQIFNVIRGEMSLVGPRPCTPVEFSRYQAWQRERVSVPPGLTGYWQVNGKNKTTFSEMIAMDLFYAENVSVWLDLTILLRTAPAVLRQSVESATVSSSGRIENSLPCSVLAASPLGEPMNGV